MDDDTFQDSYESAVGIGVENLAILRLAAAWCENIGVTKGPLGTGLVEVATGLPISGGSLRCEHAKAPTSFGMKLVHGAVEFYEQNCIGCSARMPTVATEHLGTWADKIIAERRKREQEIEQAGLEAERARRRRRDDRRLRFGIPNPTGQSILDLIDRVDGETEDKEAERLLLRHAEMSPGDFSDPLLQHMTDEAIAIGNNTLLAAVVAVFERDGRPGTSRMLQIAFEALSTGVAPMACGWVIAACAQEFCADEAALGAVVRLAAGSVDLDLWHRLDARPAALLRLYDIDSHRTAEFLGAKLRDRNVRIRSTAAHAAEKLVAARSNAGSRLLGALLDAIALPDKSQYHGDPFASSQAEKVVADILVASPLSAAAEIDHRMTTSDRKYARELWRCYDHAVRSRSREPLLPAVSDVIGRRAAALLLQSDLDPELGRDIADTLSLLCQRNGDVATLGISELINLLLAWADRFERFDSAANQPTVETPQEQSFLHNMELMGQRTTLSSVLTELEEALEARAKRDPTDFVERLRLGAWADVEDSRHVRTALLDVIGRVVKKQADLGRAEPLLLEATESADRIGERAAAYRAFAEIGREDVILPAWLPESLIAAFNDQYLVVGIAAMRALRRIEVPAEITVDVINHLLRFAAVYGPKRIHTDEVCGALSSVLRLAKGKQYAVKAEELVLGVISGLPSAEAVEMLSRLPLNREHRSWPATAVGALKADPDPRWSRLRSDECEEVLRHLATSPTGGLAELFDELEKIGLERLPHDRLWAWAVSDVLARHGEHQRAAAVCDAVVAGLPDTTENRGSRQFARQVSFGHHLDAAVTIGHDSATSGLLAEWLALSAESED